jgi:hypothetical protein
LFYGLVGGAILLVLLVAGAFFALRYAKGVVDQLTDTQPMTLPKVQLSDEQMDRLRDRVETFRAAVRENQPTEPLTLTSDELNALIATDPDLIPLRNRLYATLEGDRLKAQMSFPAEDLGFERFKGRYVNATGTFAASLTDGALDVRAESLEAKGRPLSPTLMRQISSRNLASRLNNDQRVVVGLSKLQEIRVKDGRLVIVPRR